jgi:hypothetical protein
MDTNTRPEQKIKIVLKTKPPVKLPNLQEQRESLARLSLIEMLNPQWAFQLIEFVAENPEFGDYLRVAALDPGPAEIPFELKSVKDMLKYYVCFSSVNANYGEKIYQFVRVGDLTKLTEKKRTIIEAIIRLPEITEIESFNRIKIKGVGEGAMTYVRENYFKYENIAYPTDRIFQKGLCKVYKLNSVTLTEAKNYINKWQGNKSIGCMFCFQAAHYM